MSKPSSVTLVFLLSVFVASSANSQTITGMWKRSVIHSGSFRVALGDQSGPILFGSLPTPGTMVIEVAQATETRNGSGSHALPIPVYSDGTPADPGEILWTAMIELEAQSSSTSPLGLTATVDYSGGNMFSLGTEVPQSLLFGVCRGYAGLVPLNLATVCVSVTAVAIRTEAPLPTQESTWGGVKDKYSN